MSISASSISVLVVLLVGWTGACVVGPEVLDALQSQWLKSIEQRCFHHSFLAAKPFLAVSLNRSEIYAGVHLNCDDDCDKDGNCTYCRPPTEIGIEYRQATPSYDVNADIRERSVCPWSYVEAYNTMMRYPPVLVEAECLCYPDGSCPCFFASDDSSCEAVRLPIPILVNTLMADDRGNCIFEEKDYELSVGCTCTKYIVATSQ